LKFNPRNYLIRSVLYDGFQVVQPILVVNEFPAYLNISCFRFQLLYFYRLRFPGDFFDQTFSILTMSRHMNANNHASEK